MLLHHRRRLVLEQLEDRWVPASISLRSGTLTITGPRVIAGSTNLLVDQLPDGRFRVTDNGNVQGTFTASNIKITGTNFADNLTVRVNDSTLSGWLQISSGAGHDTVNIQGTSAGAAIGSSVAVDLGFGNDTLNVATTGRLDVGGATQVIGYSGTDTVNIGHAAGASGFWSSFAIYSVQNLTFGTGAQADRINGNVTISSLLTPTTTTVEDVAMNVMFNAGTQLDGDVVVTGTSKNDQFLFLNGAAGYLGGVSPVTLTINSGDGDDTITVSTTFNGTLEVDSGAGNDTVSLDAQGTAMILDLVLGTGNDTLTLDAASSYTGTALGGDPIAAPGDTINLNGNSFTGYSEFETVNL